MMMKLPVSSRPPPLLPLAVLLATTSTYALPNVDVREVVEEAPDEKGTRYVDALLMAIISWNVMVVTLEVNDFRHRLMKAYEESPSFNRTSHRYIASLMAVRYGMRDALIDWSIMYTIGYAIVAGITYTDADPDSLLVFLGFSLIFSAALLALSGLKFPRWLGFYRFSRHQILQDTSNLAPQAVHELTTEGSSLASFRYQVRLGVGRHFSQFIYFLLPFYVGLKVWAYLLSILTGALFGHVVLFVVFVCRQTFNRHRGHVAIGASVFISIISAVVFTRGMNVVEEGWQRNVGNKENYMVVSFSVWLACCLAGLGVEYYEHRRLSKESAENEEDEAHLFEDEAVTKGNVISESETGLEALIGGDEAEEDGPKTSTSALKEPLLHATSRDRRDIMKKAQEQKLETLVRGVETEEDCPETATSALEEPLFDDTRNRRDIMKKDSLDAQEQSYFYQTVYFDRVKFHGAATESLSGCIESGDIDIDEGSTPKEIYNKFAAIEQSNMEIKW
eukprot:CAMPEP_0201904060 /NCGR_PEP_ID=MMETSP0902-20130614/55799_1 /ASSEMBLY_ACC=CAM_ASM_000551 /TAXON_ID=420261 /ORGANISM="Thalassiosira antarctica, Strain CCMP982" /LENGTH=504 /DNA_ID=CAMNT_0048438131 /DNA_START=23 /DNA_END=1534 /DNA_ORIENTATION=-